MAENDLMTLDLPPEQNRLLNDWKSKCEHVEPVSDLFGLKLLFLLEEFEQYLLILLFLAWKVVGFFLALRKSSPKSALG